MSHHFIPPNNDVLYRNFKHCHDHYDKPEFQSKDVSGPVRTMQIIDGDKTYVGLVGSDTSLGWTRVA